MITITEALAELKLIKAKIDKKLVFIASAAGRQEGAKDPFEKDGGAVKLIEADLQAIADLMNRFVNIRSAIAAANAANSVAVCGISHTVADWLVWRRDVAPMIKSVNKALVDRVAGIRGEAQKHGWSVVQVNNQPQTTTDVIINIDEKKLSDSIERTQEILDSLDGKLSLHNATVSVEV